MTLTPFDLEYLQHDLLDIMRKMIPDFAEGASISPSRSCARAVRARAGVNPAITQV